MIGPMKKKMMTTGILAFLIPTVAFVAIFAVYAGKKKNEIEQLKREAAVVERYVFSGDMPIDHIITSNDVRLVNVKEMSAPLNSYDTFQLSEIIGRRLKIDAKDRTIVSESMFYTEDDVLNIDVRAKEFNMITLPSDLVKGDYIDIRITLPTGEDYIVVSGTEVIALGSSDETNTIFLNIDEEDILRLNSAIIESYISQDAIEVYAIKYVNPSQQLFDYETVDYVERYEEAVLTLIEASKTTEIVQGPDKDEPVLDENNNPVLDQDGKPTYKRVSGDKIEKIVVKKESELDIKDIAATAGMDEEDAKAIRSAKENNDSALLSVYRSYLITKKTPLVENYPVRKEVAALLAKNPNILDEIRSKYNVEALEAQRDSFIDTSIWEYDEYTGEIIENETAIGNVRSALQEKINIQKEERRNYLQSMIRNSLISGN